MFKQLIATAVIVLGLAACGDPGSTGATSSAPDTAPFTTPPQSTTTPPDASLGGFGSPAQNEGEFTIDTPPRPVRGELLLADGGCWYVDFGEVNHLVVFPAGFEIPFSDDPSIVVASDDTAFASGDTIDGEAHEVRTEDVPGGDAGRWGNYVSFCNPSQPTIAVFDVMEPAFDPELLGSAAFESMAAVAQFTKSWPCGRGWAASTADEQVALLIYQQSEETLAAGTEIALPTNEWRADLVVGKHLFVNHCDDVLESWEPTAVVGRQWSLSDGTLELVDGLPTGTDSGLVRAVLTDATVTTETGTTIELGSVELLNTAFNFFAG